MPASPAEAMIEIDVAPALKPGVSSMGSPAEAGATSALAQASDLRGMTLKVHDQGIERKTAAALFSMSSSVVAQLDTEMRITPTPCHDEPPSQHVPSF